MGIAKQKMGIAERNFTRDNLNYQFYSFQHNYTKKWISILVIDNDKHNKEYARVIISYCSPKEKKPTKAKGFMACFDKWSNGEGMLIETIDVGLQEVLHDTIMILGGG